MHMPITIPSIKGPAPNIKVVPTHSYYANTVPHKAWSQLTMYRVNLLAPLLFLLASSIPRLADSADGNCVYTVYIRTGSVIKGGTDSIISLTIGDAAGDAVFVGNLETWGLMDPGHDYYERGDLDIFSGRGRCLSGAPCYLNLTSDGSGSGHGWYVNYVEVTSTGPHISCKQQLFTVENWLAMDRSPYSLEAIRNYCDLDDGNVIKLGRRLG